LVDLVGFLGELGRQDVIAEFVVDVGYAFVDDALGSPHLLVLLAQFLVVVEGLTPFLLGLVDLADLGEHVDFLAVTLEGVVEGDNEVAEAFFQFLHFLLADSQIVV
jgi:hypothetical protein